MRLSHARRAMSARFDDPNLVSCAGLVAVMALADRCGLARLLVPFQRTGLPSDRTHPWGAAAAYLMGSGRPTHAVDVTDTLPAGVASLCAHGAYIDGLGRDFHPDRFLHSMTTHAGKSLGVAHAVAFEHVQIQGV
jgi:hypothetical protein